MSIVTLVSGGMDSSLMALLAAEEGMSQFPLFIDYGQLNHEREWYACEQIHRVNGLPRPERLSIADWGRLFASGLTSASMHIVDDAFLPNRNLLFLVAGGAYAWRVGAKAVAIGLLDERSHLFPDQTRDFVNQAEALLSRSLGSKLHVVAPLMSLTKRDVVALAQSKGLHGTYSCHLGDDEPCGECIACREYAPDKEAD